MFYQIYLNFFFLKTKTKQNKTKQKHACTTTGNNYQIVGQYILLLLSLLSFVQKETIMTMWSLILYEVRM